MSKEVNMVKWGHKYETEFVSYCEEISETFDFLFLFPLLVTTKSPCEVIVRSYNPHKPKSPIRH